MLLAGATGLSTALAGCGGVEFGDQPAEPPGAEDTGDDPTHEPPSTPPAEFKIERESDEFDDRVYEFGSYPEYEGFDAHDASEGTYKVPDSRLTRVEVEGSHVTVTIESCRVDRPMYVRVVYNTDQGDVAETDERRIGQSDDFTTHEIEFNTPGATFPELESGYAHVVASDTHQGAPADRLLKIHQYLAIPNSQAENGIHFLNDEGLNWRSHWHERDGRIITYPPENVQARHEIESGSNKTIFLASTTNAGGIVGGSATVSQSQANGGSIEGQVSGAQSNSTISGLAYQVGACLENNGVTSQFEKLSALANLVQGIPYKSAASRNNNEYITPLKVLYENHGNCTELTYLYAALAKCDPFNTRTGVIMCEIRGIGLHLVVGIDERDLGDPPSDVDIHYIEPGEGSRSHEIDQSCLPDTRYAFLELTARKRIGQFSQSTYSIHGIAGTSDFECA